MRLAAWCGENRLLRERALVLHATEPEAWARSFGLPDANITHLDMTPRHMFGLRPVAGFSDYASPIPGLYACGAGVYQNQAHGHSGAGEHALCRWRRTTCLSIG